jgi:PAS domain S-box-containing protein
VAVSSRVSEIVDAVRTKGALLPSGDVDFILSRILTQASSPDQVMRLVTTAIPSIVPCRTALAWHPSKSGDYYQRAPKKLGRVLARLTSPSRLETGEHCSCWAFPLSVPVAGEPIFLITLGSEPLSSQDAFLLSALAQQCGAVIGKLERVSAERANRRQAVTRNAELESTASSLTRVTEIHRRLTEIVANAGEAGIANTLHDLTALPVLVQDGRGNPRAMAGDVPAEHLVRHTGARREQLIGRLRVLRRAVYYRCAWVVLASPSDDVHGVIALIDPGRSASDIDIAALEYAATALSVELARVHSVAETELRSRAARERDIAQARAAELAASEARQRAILDAANDAVINVDGQGRVIYVNSAFEHIFDCRADDVMGRKLAERVVPRALREAYEQGFACYLAAGQRRLLDRRIETTAMRADGCEFPVEVTVTRAGLSEEPMFTLYIRDITERQQAQQELTASRARLVAASDIARQRVTRDLHDGAQQRFVTSLIHLQLAEQQLEGAPEQARELLGLALRDAKRGIDDLREIAAGIHPAILTQRGLAAAIDALAAELPIPVELDVPDQRLPSVLETNVYFFCSEALTNVVKHARAQSASVRVDLDDRRCTVEVRDDGMGGVAPRADNSGLNGLRDRIGALSGTMDIICPAAGGTVIRASIPLPCEPASPASDTAA